MVTVEYDARLLWAAACVAFFGFLHLGKVSPPTSTAPAALLVGDVAILKPPSSSMVRLHLKKSKTNPFGNDINISLGMTGQDICPVTAISPTISLSIQKAKVCCLFWQVAPPC